MDAARRFHFVTPRRPARYVPHDGSIIVAARHQESPVGGERYVVNSAGLLQAVKAFSAVGHPQTHRAVVAASRQVFSIGAETGDDDSAVVLESVLEHGLCLATVFHHPHAGQFIAATDNQEVTLGTEGGSDHR